MNTNSQDVVKSVESTSNEQRQTVKPIVISRRRLLRAGVAGIPVVLTMAGVAPAADDIRTLASAASGLMYGGNKVYNRFYDNKYLRDGLVWTDHNGFVLLSEGGVSTDDFSASADATSVELEDVSVSQWTGEGTAPDPKTFTLSVPAINAAFNAYLHKTGVWYTDRKVLPSGADLLQFLQTLQPSVLVGGTTTVTGANISFDSNNPVTFQSNDLQWYNTDIEGWSIESGQENSPQNYYLLPTPNENETIAVNLNLKVSFSYQDQNGGDNRTYSLNNASVTVPITLDVSGIPAQVNPGGI